MKMLRLTLLLSMTATALSTVTAQEIQRLDPALDQLVPANAKLEKVAGGFDKWTEGPVWTHQGSLLFAEIPANQIRIWKPGEKDAPVFMEKSGYVGAKPYGGPEPGSNGMTLDPVGRVTVAGHARRNVWRLETLDPRGTLTVLADSYQGKKLNSPNDLVYRSDGSLYFTDPPYGLPTQQDTDPEKELKVNGVYRIPNARQHKAGAPPDRDKLQLVISDLPRPNGIAFSPDEKVLYIADSGDKVWKRYTENSCSTLRPTKLRVAPTESASIRKAIFTALARVVCGLSRPKASTSAPSRYPRSLPTSPGGTRTVKPCTSRPARACTGLSSACLECGTNAVQA
jgi:gluconolactonase